MTALGEEDITRAFRECGVTPGSVLMLHSDAIFLAQAQPMPTESRFALLFQALDDVLAPTGTLVAPTFTYSATQGEPYDVENTPSTVGALTEHFRGLPEVRRSRDPIFSVAARGKRAPAYAAVEVGDAFGEDSIFGFLDRDDANLACLACSFDRITYTHFVEQRARVDYRHFKDFPYTLVQGGTATSGTIRYFARDVERETQIDLRSLRSRLADEGKLRQQALGRFALTVVRCSDFRNAALALLAQDPSALIREVRT